MNKHIGVNLLMVIFIKYLYPLMAILLLVPGCAPRMTLEEAKKISISMDETSVAKPSRRINDILTVLDQPGLFDVNVTQKAKSTRSSLPPDKASDKTLANFYQERGEAARKLGYTKQALDDLRMALMYLQKTGGDDPELLLHLGEAEQASGNFPKAVELFQRSLNLKDAVDTYAQLTGAHIKMGDLETAERFSREGYALHVHKTGLESRNQQNAEAVSGLGKAFFFAGTKALLVTMWSVETTSAKKLVTGVFQAQKENKVLSRAQALRKSMLNLIDEETLNEETTGKIAASYAHPLFWAPFVIVGDPGKSDY